MLTFYINMNANYCNKLELVLVVQSLIIIENRTNDSSSINIFKGQLQHCQPKILQCPFVCRSASAHLMVGESVGPAVADLPADNATPRFRQVARKVHWWILFGKVSQNYWCSTLYFFVCVRLKFYFYNNFYTISISKVKIFTLILSFLLNVNINDFN